MSPLVIDATIGGSRPADHTMKGPPTERETVIVRTAFEVTVNEVFKSDRPVGATGRIEVVQIGGERDRGPEIQSVTDPTFQRFRAGERYVLFLKPSPFEDGTYVTSTGTADGALLLADDVTVQSRGAGPLASQLERYSREDLLNRLRTWREQR